MGCYVQGRTVGSMQIYQGQVSRLNQGLSELFLFFCQILTLVPGIANRELSQLGLILHKPAGLLLVSNMCSWVGLLVKVNTLMTFSSTTTIRSLRSLTDSTSVQNSNSITIFFFKSSQILTLFEGYLGLVPPPTIAR